MINREAFNFISCKKHCLKKGKKIKKIKTNTNALCYITSGSGSIMIDGVRYEVRQGTCLLLRSSVVVEKSEVSQNRINFFILQFEGMLNYGINQDKNELSMFIKKVEIIQIASQVKIESVLEMVSENKAEHAYLLILRQQALLYQLLFHIFSDKLAAEHNKNASITYTINYLEKNFMEQLKISDLPRIACMTPSSFCRAFKRETGQTPSGYVQNLRNEKAKALLLFSQYSVKDVARSVGYNDELYFSRLFKKFNGVSPTIYRKKSGPRIAVVSKRLLQDHLLALGIKPVAAPCFPSQYNTKTGFPDYLQNQLYGTHQLNAEQLIAPQDVIASSPDYIFTLNVSNKQNDILSGSLNTRILHLDNYLNWESCQRKIAKVVGKEDEAEEVIKNITKAELVAKKRLSKITENGKWALIRVMKNSVLIHGRTGHAVSDLFYQGLGFQPEDMFLQSITKEYSFLELLEFNPERLIILWSEVEALERVKENSLWQQLKAVMENQVYIPNSFNWDPWGPLGRKYMIDECVNFFLQSN